MKKLPVILSAVVALSLSACDNKTESERVYDETSANRNQQINGQQGDQDNPNANGNTGDANTGTPQTAQNPANPETTAPPGTPEPTAATGGQGETLFKQYCATCHQANGQGLPNVYPPLAKSDFLNADPKRAIAGVTNGLSGEITVNGKKYNMMMPPAPYDDQQIADVMTYVFSQWGNNGTKVTAADVKAVRKK